MGMPLKVASFGESRVAMKTCIRFRKPYDILDDERVPPANTDCQYILQLNRRVPPKEPYHVPINIMIRPECRANSRKQPSDLDAFQSCLTHQETFLGSRSAVGRSLQDQEQLLCFDLALPRGASQCSAMDTSYRGSYRAPPAACYV